MLKFDTNGVAAALVKAGVELPDDFSIADRSYAAMTRGFLEKAFSDSLKKWVWELGIRYRQDCEDCDDFARFAASVAQLWNAKSENKGHALAFGEFWYVKDGGEGHAINVALVEGGAVVFYEPQTQRIVELSEIEMWNATMIRF